MRITCTRTGGFAGIKRVYRVDSETLPKREAQSLQKLLTSADFTRCAGAARDPLVAVPDAFHYTLEIEDGGTHEVVRLQAAASPDAQALIDWLVAHASATAKS